MSDLTVEQNLAIKLAIDTMDRNFNRYWNKAIRKGEIRIGFGEAINILEEMLKEQKNE